MPGPRDKARITYHRARVGRAVRKVVAENTRLIRCNNDVMIIGARSEFRDLALDKDMT